MTTRITLLYVILGLLWILASEVVLLYIPFKPEDHTMVQLIKGSVFVFVTAIIASYYISKYLKQLQSSKKALEEKEEVYRSLFEHNPDLVCSLDLRGRFTNVNPSTIRLSGYSKSELINAHFIPYLATDSKDMAINLFRKAYRGEAQTFEVGIKHKLGHRIDFLVKSSPIIIEDDIVGVYIVGKDITAWKQAQQKIDYMSTHDALTGLPNRTYFKQLLHENIYSAKRNNEMIALLLIDIDRFRVINDALGHENGDKLLRAIAHRLSRQIEKHHILSRIGGDEFTIVMPNLSHPNQAIECCKQITTMFEESFHFGGYESHLTPSIGVVLFPTDGEDVESLVARADTAMYRAKSQGANQFVMYSKISDDFTTSNLALENDLRKAIERDELKLHYQPIISLKTGKVIAVEALIRWEHPQLGLLSPMEFIPLAEDTGLILPIGEWVIKTACQQMKQWHNMGLSDLSISINLSARQMSDEQLFNNIKYILRQEGLDPSRLELEVTESLAMYDVEKMFVQMQAFTQLGVKMSIDDFGTGYSSLSYLTQFPIHSLKIDRTFISKISDNPDDLVVVTAIIAMAHSLQLKVIAEGVENEEQLRKLHELGCDNIQGFLLSKPLPAQNISPLFHKDFSELYIA